VRVLDRRRGNEIHAFPWQVRVSVFVAFVLLVSLIVVVPVSPVDAVGRPGSVASTGVSVRGTVAGVSSVASVGSGGLFPVWVNPEVGKPGWPGGLYGISTGAGLELPGVLRVPFYEGLLVPGALLEGEVLPVELAGGFSPVGGAVSVAFVGAERTTVSDALLEFAFDVTDLAFIFGGNLRDRIELVAHSECVDDGAGGLTCSGSEKIPTRRNVEGEVTGQVRADLVGSGGLDAVGGVTVIGLASGVRSLNGDYAASPFEPLASYQVGLFTGSAESSYPIPVPPSAGGSGPDVVLRYSSGVADLLNGGTNAQASDIGVGWSYSPGFISMTLPECGTGVHLCWVDDPVYMINLFGVRSKLIPDDTDGNVFHPQADPLWRVERKNDLVTPDVGDVYWQVTATDGRVFRLGGDKEPYTGADQLSAFWVPVFGAPECPGAVCVKTYRWNLDWVEDPNGNATSFFYTTQINHYENGREYVKAGYVDRIEYTKRSDSIQANARVTFTKYSRCEIPGPCDWPDDYPDTPNDLACSGGTCPVKVPTFWSSEMLHVIETQIWESSAWQPVSRYELVHSFPFGVDDEGDESEPRLWLDSITRKGSTGGVLGTTVFDAVMLNNRVEFHDWDAGPGVDGQYVPRIATITNIFGGVTTFTYSEGAIGLPGCLKPDGDTWADQHTMCFQEADPHNPDGGDVIWNKYRVETRTHTSPGVSGTVTERMRYTYYWASWHITDFEFRQNQYHSDFRGHNQVIVQDDFGNQTTYRFFQGMDGDVNGTEIKDVEVVDSSGTSYTDSNWLAGRQLERLLRSPGADAERTRYTYVSTVTANADGTAPGPAPDPTDIVPLIGDWDGNGTTDVGYYRRDTQFFYGPYAQPVLFGNPGDTPIIGDWEGDGRDGLGVYQPQLPQFVQYRGATIPFGIPGDIPLVGDWNANTIDDVGVFRPSNLTFYFNGQPDKPFGDIGDEPLTGDWNADGADQPGVYRPSNQTFYLEEQAGIPIGIPSDDPLTGDWTGDNAEQPGVYRASNQTFYLHNQPDLPFGTPDDVPVIGDWDGDGADNVGAYRFSQHRLYLRNSDGTTTEKQFGSWGGDGARDARWVDVVSVESTSFGVDFAPTRTASTSYEYDSRGNLHFQRLHGDTATATDNRVIRYLYYASGIGIDDAVRRTELWDGDNPGVVGTELAYTEYFYDNTGEPTSGGNLTSVRSWTDRQEGGTGTYIETNYSYDTWGRQTQARDGNNNPITTTYDPFYGHALTVTNALGHETSFTVNPRWGVATTSTDPNGNTTTLGYDQHGRLETVTHPGDTAPSVSYMYSPLGAGVESITTTTQTAGGPLTTVSYVDSVGRPLQTQTPSPTNTAMRTVATNLYDTAGRLERSTEPYETSGTPGDGYLPLSDGDWDTLLHTRAEFDARGPTTSHLYDGATLLRSVTTLTDGWQTKHVDANGDQTIRFSDAFGNLTQVDEYDSGSVYATTTYGYDKQNNLTSVTDNDSNVTNIVYDHAGSKTSMTDPDLGTWTYTYDNANNLTSQVDGRGQALHFSYDSINRMTSKNADTPTGILLAEWGYDTPGFLGLPASSTAYEPAGTVTTTYAAYDQRNRITSRTWSIPGPAGGDFAMAWTYHPDNQINTITYPTGNTGGLGETVTVGYTTTGLPQRLTGTDTYVDAAAYQPWGAPATQTWGTAATQVDRSFTYQDDRRPLASTAATGAGIVFSATLTHDLNGNVTSVVDAINASQRQCYGYDHLSRLTAAFTKDQTPCSGDPDTSVGVGGFDYTYSYNTIGNMVTNTALAGTYTYGENNAGPHAVTSIGTDYAYTHDGNGNQTTRTTPTGTDTLTWDPNNRLASVTGTGGVTSFSYDADGVRVARSTPTEDTVYVGGVYERSVTQETAAVPTLIASTVTLVHGDRTPTIQLPDGVQEGDVIIVHVGSRMPVNRYVSDWGGLTEVHQARRDLHSTSLAYTVATGDLVAGGEIGLGVRFKWGFQTVTIHIWRGGDPSSPIAVEATRGDYATTNTDMTFSGITTTGDGATVVLFAYGRNTGDSYTPPPGWIEATDLDVPWDRGAVSGYATLPAGATGDITFTRQGATTTGFGFFENRAAASIIQLDPETEAASTTETVYYTFGGTLIAERRAGVVSWIVTDHLGSPATAINTTTGVVTRRLHDPYGTTRQDTGIGTDRAFTGQYQDPTTDLLFYNARYYDPLNGRFISPDSIVPNPANPQDLNRYSYVQNNPVTYTDPTGNCLWIPLSGDSACPGGSAARTTGAWLGRNKATIAGIGTGIVVGGVCVAASSSTGFLVVAGCGGVAAASGGVVSRYVAGDDPFDPKRLAEDTAWGVALGGSAYGAGRLLPRLAQSGTSRLRKLLYTDDIATNGAGSPWDLGWGARGLEVEARLGGNLPRSFPTIDVFSKGTATSIKSVDLTAATYQSAGRLSSRLTGYVDSVAGFNGASYAGRTVAASDVMARELVVAIQPGVASSMQLGVLDDIVRYGASQGVKVTVVPVP